MRNWQKGCVWCVCACACVCVRVRVRVRACGGGGPEFSWRNQPSCIVSKCSHMLTSEHRPRSRWIHHREWQQMPCQLLIWKRTSVSMPCTAVPSPPQSASPPGHHRIRCPIGQRRHDKSPGSASHPAADALQRCYQPPAPHGPR